MERIARAFAGIPGRSHRRRCGYLSCCEWLLSAQWGANGNARQKEPRRPEAGAQRSRRSRLRLIELLHSKACLSYIGGHQASWEVLSPARKPSSGRLDVSFWVLSGKTKISQV